MGFYNYSASLNPSLIYYTMKRIDISNIILDRQTLIILSLSLAEDPSSFYFPHSTCLRTDGEPIMINNAGANRPLYNGHRRNWVLRRTLWRGPRGNVWEPANLRRLIYARFDHNDQRMLCRPRWLCPTRFRTADTSGA